MDSLFTEGAWLAIGAMVVMTLLAKMMGFWVLGRVPLTPRLRRGLEALPGGVILATIVPITLESGPAGLLGIGVATLVMAATKKDWLAVGLGLASVAGYRAFLEPLV
ncbi:AzlD domain-containing protein [Ahrensia marina]|uniref:AzlD family protein n=1 Tax=Ahrensia marina TaxID=1514904 RepID=UPI0035CEB443